jgi:hypothetical protein
MALVIQHPSITKQSPQTTKQEMPIGDSSFLQHVSYDPSAFQMTVTMKNGAQYLYFMVYPTIMEQWIQAQSKGEFYTKVVKGQHQSTRIISKNIGKKVSHTGKKERPHG